MDPGATGDAPLSGVTSGPPEPGPRLGARTLRATLWAYGAYVGQRGIVLVLTAVLARLLAPAEFGLVSLALMVIAILETLADMGLSSALVVVDEADAERRAHTVFRWVIGVSALITLVVAAIGPLAATFFDEPELTRMLPVLGFAMLIRSAGSTHYALAQKRLDFRSRTVAELGEVLVRSILAVSLAVGGAGAWSLVAGHLAGSVAFATALWLLVPWRPDLRGRTGPLGDLLRFGGALTGVNVLAAVIANADYLVVGRILGTAALGLYTIGFKLPEVLIANLSIVAGRVLFPAFAGTDRDQLQWRLTTAVRFTVLLCLPIAVVMSVLAGDLVRLVFGDEWTGAVDAMRFLTAYSFAAALGMPIGSVYKATGRADILLKLAVPRAAVGIGAVILVAPHGIAWVAGANATAELLSTVVAVVVARRVLGVRARALLAACLPFIAGAALAGAVAAAVTLALRAPLPTILLGGTTAVVVYAAVVWFTGRDVLEHLWRLARPGRTADAPA